MRNKNENMNIRITRDHKFLLEQLGGQAKGFELIVGFFLENYDMAEVYEKEINEKNAMEKIKARK